MSFRKTKGILHFVIILVDLRGTFHWNLVIWSTIKNLHKKELTCWAIRFYIFLQICHALELPAHENVKVNAIILYIFLFIIFYSQSILWPKILQAYQHRKFQMNKGTIFGVCYDMLITKTKLNS